VSHKSLNRQNQQSDMKTFVDQVFTEALLKGILISFLNEFLNVTDGSYESERALKRYVNEVLIENVNYTLCSEIWNDCLLLPHIVNEDPNLCFDEILKDLISQTF